MNFKPLTIYDCESRMAVSLSLSENHVDIPSSWEWRPIFLFTLVSVAFNPLSVIVACFIVNMLKRDWRSDEPCMLSVKLFSFPKENWNGFDYSMIFLATSIADSQPGSVSIGCFFPNNHFLNVGFALGSVLDEILKYFFRRVWLIGLVQLLNHFHYLLMLDVLLFTF